MVSAYDKGQGSFQPGAQRHQVGQPNLLPAPDLQQLIHCLDAQPRDAKHLLLWRPVEIHWKAVSMVECPGEFGIDVEGQHAVFCRARGDFRSAIAVKTHEPVSLIQSVLTHQRRLAQRELLRRVRNRTESRKVHTPKAIAGIEVRRNIQNGGIAGIIGSNDHLR